MRALCRDKWNSSKLSFVYSKHFKETGYVTPPGLPNPRLKRNAVPSIVDFPIHMLAPQKIPRRELKRISNSTDQNNPFDESMLTQNFSHTTQTNYKHKQAKRKNSELTPTKLKLKRKIKVLQQKIRRQTKKISSLKDIIDNLKRNQLLKEAPAELLKDQFSGLTLEMLKNDMQNAKRKCRGHRYTEEVKKFALTVHFYLPKAYPYMRKICSLPHQSSIRNWISSVNCEPGFHADVLQNLSEQLQKRPEMSDCALMMDGMVVRKQVLYDTKNMKYSGFVDCGGIVAESTEDQATEALVFLVVGLKHFWKCPIGYFLTNKLNGDAQASLIRSALSLLADHGFQVWSVTCDGTSSNLDTFRLLGCKFVPNYDNIKVSFPHPTRNRQVYAILDPCHMVKLARNTLGDLGNLKDNEHYPCKIILANLPLPVQVNPHLMKQNSLVCNSSKSAITNYINLIRWFPHSLGLCFVSYRIFLSFPLIFCVFSKLCCSLLLYEQHGGSLHARLQFLSIDHRELAL